jgi:hypothetical protein
MCYIFIAKRMDLLTRGRKHGGTLVISEKAPINLFLSFCEYLIEAEGGV